MSLFSSRSAAWALRRGLVDRLLGAAVVLAVRAGGLLQQRRA